jgi:stearoyl-CoA desaturase (delta-9 desaturase)
VPRLLIAIIVGLATSQIGIVCTTVYLHRSISHRAVTFSMPFQLLFRTLIWMTTGIKPREWAAVHRRHHAFTDVEGDPHSPLLLGLWRVELTNALLYRRTARDGVTVDKYARDLPPDKYDKVVFDHPYIGLAIGITILCLLLGWQYGLIAAAVHMTSYILLNGAVNSFAHVYGKQHYENTAHNLQWLAWLVAGEGLHNNHHAAPTSARLSHRPGEMDPGWWVISLLVRAKQAKVRLEEPKFIKASAGAGAP